MDQFADSARIAALVGEALAHLGVSAPDGATERLAAYAREILRWNARVNLTGARGEAAFVRGPLFDALTLLPVLAGDAPLVDVGSGGGLPGVPAAIARPGLAVTLVEPRGKRAVFLRHAVDALRLGARVEEARDTALPNGAFGAAVAQAVWPAAEWVARAVRLVRPGGAIYALSSEELDPGALPPGCAIDAAYGTARPLDGARRFSYRVRPGV